MSEVATGPLLRGERVILRPMSHEDAAHLVRWSADADFSWFKWGRQPGRFADVASARQWIDRFAERAGKVFVVEHEGRPIGSANYRDLVPKARSCEVGIGIGETALWNRGLGREALRLLVQHLVDDLGVHRVSLHVLAFNDRAIASYKACGFEVEGIERDAVMTDRGDYADDVAMAYVVGRPPPDFAPRPITLEGRHVRLEPLRMDHAEELYRAVDEDETWTWLGDAPPRSVADIERYVRRALDLQITGEQLPWLTRRAADRRAIGTTRYGAIDRTNRSLEIGWTMLSREARRTAANTEAKYLQVRHAFEDLHALRVWLKTDLRNERSQRAIERIGAKREGVIRNERVVASGRVRDAVYYSVIDRDWTETKEHLQRLLER